MVNLCDPDSMPVWLASLFVTQKQNQDIIAGINDDDCAIIRFGDAYLIVTTDFLNSSPIAVQLGLGSIYDLGKLVVSASISDLCGTGAQPKAILVGVMMQKDSSCKEFENFMAGVYDISSNLGIPVVGGDTKLGASKTFYSVGLGYANSLENLFIKNRAKIGDAVWVSGSIGSCNAAVLGICRNSLSNSQYLWAIKSILSPELPIAKSCALSSSRKGRAGIDMSDGFAADLNRMCTSSGVGAIVELDKIPVDPVASEIARILAIPEWGFAFGAGGDAQFIATSDESDSNFLESIGFIRVGSIIAEPVFLMKSPAGNCIPMPTQGHRDANRKNFVDEISDLVWNAVKCVGGNSD